MSHTEAQAKKLWCPMARAGQDGSAFNRYHTGMNAVSEDCLCLASGCGVWVWDTNEWDHNEFIPDPSGELDENGERKGTIEPHPEKRRGHCGLIHRG